MNYFYTNYAIFQGCPQYFLKTNGLSTNVLKILCTRPVNPITKLYKWSLASLQYVTHSSIIHSRLLIYRKKVFSLNKKVQISESIELGILLALSGGFMDAYSYIGRGEVFANAQTGNMLLLGVHLSEGNIPAAIRYLCPVLAFTFGIALADIVRNSGIGKHLHWRQISVIVEAIILAIVSFFPQSHNLLANSLTSLACGIQVESFRKIHGNGIATTMCIGNLRSGTQNIYTFFQTKKKESLEKGILYYGIILCFICGAIIGNQCIKYFHERAILVSSVLLLLAFIMMFITRDDE